MAGAGDKVYNIDCRDTSQINAALREPSPETISIPATAIS